MAPSLSQPVLLSTSAEMGTPRASVAHKSGTAPRGEGPAAVDHLEVVEGGKAQQQVRHVIPEGGDPERIDGFERYRFHGSRCRTSASGASRSPDRTGSDEAEGK